MRPTVRTFAAALLLALCFSPIAGAAKADAFAVACATHEVEIITAVEDHGAAGDVSPDRLAEADRTWMRARALCYLGRVDEAVALYDSITTDLGPAQIAQHDSDPRRGSTA